MSSNVISLSGGKDSTAMLLMMLERGEPITDIVFFDTGWEFPQMHEHLARLELYIGRRIVRLQSREPFNYFFSQRPRTRNKDCSRLGYGWPSITRRWCTREKIRAIDAYCTALSWQGHSLPIVQCIGYALDEPDRIKDQRKPAIHQNFAYPLADWRITAADALEYCKSHGFTWDGLYNVFARVSCFCCPLKQIEELQALRAHFPDLWQRMLEMESWLPEGDKGRRFGGKASGVSALDARFAAEDAFEARKLALPGVTITKPGVRAAQG